MATIITPGTPQAWSPDVQGFAPDVAVPEAVILQASTVAGRVEGDAPAVRVPYADDADAGFVAEGAVIPEANPNLAEVLVYTGKIAQLLRLSREQLDQPKASELLMRSIQRAVTTAANRAFISQAPPISPAVTPPGGIVHAATDGGTLGDNLDVVVDAVAAIERANGQATHVLASPESWAMVSKLKVGGDGINASLIGAGTAPGPLALLGIPVLVSAALEADQLLVVDKAAIVSAVGDVQVSTSEHAYYTSDSIGVRATWRFGAAIQRPARVIKLTVEAAA